MTPDDLTPFITQKPCNDGLCGAPAGSKGYIKRVGLQDVVYCAGADGTREIHYARRNAPRSETGNPTENLRTRPGIAPSKRSRILQRDNYRCLMCGATPQETGLDIGHLISRDAGLAIGMSDYELDDDENLGTLCSPCNSGQGHEPVTLRFTMNVLRVRMKYEKGRPRPTDGPDSLFDA